MGPNFLVFVTLILTEPLRTAHCSPLPWYLLTLWIHQNLRAILHLENLSSLQPQCSESQLLLERQKLPLTLQLLPKQLQPMVLLMAQFQLLLEPLVEWLAPLPPPAEGRVPLSQLAAASHCCC